MLAQETLHRPYCFIADAPHGLPPLSFIVEFRSQLTDRQITNFARHPGGGMDAVRNGRDEDLVGIESWPQAGKHPSAHGAVQQADTVCALR